MASKENNRRYYLAHRERLIKNSCERQKLNPSNTYLKNKRWAERDRKVNPERWKQIEFRKELKEYGVTLEWHALKMREQCGVCAICGNPPSRRRLAIDHCHKTEEARGLLCSRCNSALGFLELFLSEGLISQEPLGWTKKALGYLAKWTSSTAT